MKKQEIQAGDLLVSFDVLSISTNIVIDLTLQIIKNKYA